jgi:hypothetical protein
MIRMARHDEPMQRTPMTPAGCENFFGEHLEERLLF